MINSVILVGRLVKAVDVKEIGEGKKVTTFTLAVNESKDKAHFFNVVAYDKQAEILKEFTSSGSLIGVSGRLSQRKYTNKENKEVSVVEVIVNSIDLLDKKEKTE